MSKTRLSAVLLLLAGCATTVPGTSRVQPGWDARLGPGKVGLYILMPRGPYTVAQFECLSQADDALRGYDPAIRWISVDSGSASVRDLGGWDLDSLGDLLLLDTAIRPRSDRGDAPRNAGDPPGMAPATRDGIRRVCRAFGTAQLLVVEPGGSRNAKDSAKSFRDPVWFGVFDSSSASPRYVLSVPLEGARSQARSAEADWARQAWKAFVEGLEGVRERSRKAVPDGGPSK